MKLNFSLKKQEANLEADIEGLVEKSLAYKSQNADRKTRFQIRQEEKRKNSAQEHQQKMRYLYILLGLFGVLLIFGVAATIFGI